ncbi:hypothetical protein AB0K12_38800 [Nonomuraea sp. NPDC049419]|uniref:hypothetical protein n=1 Tax=Nonomuraea sp. NPDC049419 TaxID=3155772 RepID=UPI0034275410
MRTALASVGDRLLTLLAPKAVASAGGCEYEQFCSSPLCKAGSTVYPRTSYILYSNCDIVATGWCCAS